MNYNDLIELIKTKEGYTIEFKENVNSSIGREICSFANANGGKISVRRNPIIVDLIHRLNLVEKAGSGIKRIKKVMKQFELKVEFNISSFFRVIFYRPVSKSEANPKQIRSKFEVNPK